PTVKLTLIPVDIGKGSCQSLAWRKTSFSPASSLTRKPNPRLPFQRATVPIHRTGSIYAASKVRDRASSSPHVRRAKRGPRAVGASTALLRPDLLTPLRLPLPGGGAAFPLSALPLFWHPLRPPGALVPRPSDRPPPLHARLRLLWRARQP